MCCVLLANGSLPVVLFIKTVANPDCMEHGLCEPHVTSREISHFYGNLSDYCVQKSLPLALDL
jgi:hypothetical protein